eukprot:2160483-Pyramimonas_sp.AAC.1
MGDKSKKYDRQLRIWGEHGQAALENSKGNNSGIHRHGEKRAKKTYIGLRVLELCAWTVHG